LVYATHAFGVPESSGCTPSSWFDKLLTFPTTIGVPDAAAAVVADPPPAVVAEAVVVAVDDFELLPHPAATMAVTPRITAAWNGRFKRPTDRLLPSLI
jgi:hypothetical protein